MNPCTFLDMDTLSIGPYPSRKGLWSFYPWLPAHFWTWKLCPLACIPPGRGSGVFIHGSLHISGHGNSVHWPVSLQGGALEFLSMAPCTFLDMGTPSVGLYPSREGLWSFYPWLPAHFWTWELHLLAHIPPGRGTRVFIHRPLHISGHGNSVHWPVSLQGGAPEFFYPWTPAHFWTWELCLLAHIPPGRGTGVFLSMDPCTFLDMGTLSIGPYPSREGHRSFFIHGPLHISGHGNSVHWPISLQGGALEFLSTDPCTFPDMETLSIGLYPSREGHQSFYPRLPAHFQTWKLHPLACIPPGRGTGVFIHSSLHISGHGNSIHWPISLQGGALEFLYPQTPAHFWTWELHLLACIPPGRGTRVFIHRPLHISGHGNSVRWPISLQGGALEFLSMDPCTFLDMETLSIGPYPSREGHWSFYPWTPA